MTHGQPVRRVAYPGTHHDNRIEDTMQAIITNTDDGTTRHGFVYRDTDPDDLTTTWATLFVLLTAWESRGTARGWRLLDNGDVVTAYADKDMGVQIGLLPCTDDDTYDMDGLPFAYTVAQDS